MTAKFDHAGQEMCADFHQTKATVIALAAGVDIAQLADLARLIDLIDGLRPSTQTPLMMNRDLDTLFSRFGHHRIRLDEIHSHRLFNLNVNAMFQHPQR